MEGIFEKIGRQKVKIIVYSSNKPYKNIENLLEMLSE